MLNFNYLIFILEFLIKYIFDDKNKLFLYINHITSSKKQMVWYFPRKI